MKKIVCILLSGYILSCSLSKGDLNDYGGNQDIINFLLFQLLEYQPLRNGITWQNFQRVIPYGTGVYDLMHVKGSVVIKEYSRYKMWYTGYQAVGLTNGSILYSESSDGIQWQIPYQEVFIVPVTLGPLWFNSLADPRAIKVDDRYVMYFTGDSAAIAEIYHCDAMYPQWWSNFFVAVNSSIDGTYDVLGAFEPVVIRDGSLYRMWYTGSDSASRFRIMYCESETGGSNWTGHRVVKDSTSTYDVGGLSTPCVIRDGAKYKMWHTGFDATAIPRILYSESDDGITWSNSILSIDTGSEGTWDIFGVTNPHVINENGVGRMWYSGMNSSGYFSILHAESR